MKRISLVSGCLLLLTLAASAQTTFSVPQAGTAAGQGTYPQGMNNKGMVVGLYVDANNIEHGFTRTQAGVINTFNGFGSNSGKTSFSRINSSGQIIGVYTPTPEIENAESVGFLLSPGGTYAKIQAEQGDVATEPLSLNDSGVVTGVWSDFDGTGFHSFVRDALGNITLFDADPNSTNGTVSWSINASGTIAGYYIDNNSFTHGFVRDTEGNITSFDPEGSYGTWAYAINATGQIAGYYQLDATGEAFGGYIRNADASFTLFSVSGVTPYDGYQMGLNDSGETVGEAANAQGGASGWTRATNGKVTEFKFCGQTAIVGLNNAGHFTGYCGDSGQILNYEGFTF